MIILRTLWRYFTDPMFRTFVDVTRQAIGPAGEYEYGFALDMIFMRDPGFGWSGCGSTQPVDSEGEPYFSNGACTCPDCVDAAAIDCIIKPVLGPLN